MARPKSLRAEGKKALDSNSPKRRGPHRQIEPTTVLGRAGNYRWILEQAWESVWPLLSQAQTPEEVATALQNARPYEREFLPWAAAILAVLKEKRFPKRKRARINFIADSIAGIPNVSPRRSRDICIEERAKMKHAHHIVRFEFFIECSCGYEGVSRQHACPTCGTDIVFPEHFGSVFV